MVKQLSHILTHDIGVSDADLFEALKTREEKGGHVGEILIQRKVITEKQFLKALSLQYDIPFWEKLPLENIAKNFTQQVPIQFLKKYHMVPLGNDQKGHSYTGRGDSDFQAPATASGASADVVIAVNDPADFQPLDDLAGLNQRYYRHRTHE